MIPRQANEPTPAPEKHWRDERMAHLYAGSWPEVTDIPTVLNGDDVIRQAARYGVASYGLGELVGTSYCYEPSRFTSWRDHNRRLARLAELTATWPIKQP